MPRRLNIALNPLTDLDEDTVSHAAGKQTEASRKLEAKQLLQQLQLQLIYVTSECRHCDAAIVVT